MIQLQRTYEVSIWTLQDEFITILKPSNLEDKGRLKDPVMTIKDDGTEEFTFSIPMYLYRGKVRDVNPIWHNTYDGTLIEDLRKIKVTFNQGTDVQKTFEFLIVEITEKHEEDQLYCEVNCEGMAFHELGKRGYKISLTTDDFYEENTSWFIQEKDINGNLLVPVQPHATLQYWLNKFMEPVPEGFFKDIEIYFKSAITGLALASIARTNNDGTSVHGEFYDGSKWYYKIDMDWSTYADSNLRSSSRVYEEEYTSSWQLNPEKNVFEPRTVETVREKERMVDLQESNIYNLTQDLAKAFGVFCRYEYIHDDNLHIIGRVVVFYNSYIREEEGYIDLTYPYTTTAISRTRDSKDLTTKLYVQAIEEDTSASNYITIMDVEANKLHEDYILNFDYLRSIGNISEEQYAEVAQYERMIGEYNLILKSLSQSRIALQGRLPELKAQETTYTNAIQLDYERLNAANDLLNNLTDDTGIISVTAESPRTAIMIQADAEDINSYYINIPEQGILADTLRIFRSYNFATKQVDESTELISGRKEYDEYGNVNKVSSLYKTAQQSSTVYLTYDYEPQLKYERVHDTWVSRLAKDEEKLAEVQEELERTNAYITFYEQLEAEILKEKKSCTADFEKLMGPALRESYWTPEEYQDYGDNFVDTFTLTNEANTSYIGGSEFTELMWDLKPFEEEQKNYYYFGVNQDKVFYPIVDLSGHEEYVKENLKQISFIFYDYKRMDEQDKQKMINIRSFTAGAQAQYGFARVGEEVKPVLIITGIESLSDDSLKRMIDPAFEPQIGVITTTVPEEDPDRIDITIKPGSWTPEFLNSNGDGTFSELDLVYPRIKVNSLALKTSSDTLGVMYNDEQLFDFEDFDLLIRDDSEWVDDELINPESSYYLTLKAMSIMEQGGLGFTLQFKFNISNADTKIYLDALEILKENSKPKVSYSIDSSVWDKNFSYTLYDKLNRICNINDYDLKFKDVQGYIAEIEIHCDDPAEDTVEVKNYKNKFEDLFSTIVAQTASMQKNEYMMGLASAAFTTSGDIDPTLLQNSVMKADLNYAFNNGKLTIDQENGITGTSDNGVVAMRGGGIFTATKKDDEGNWIWNTGILPEGINANLITVGQLDTNKIKVYAGDQLRFQLNGDGLFAYKSFFDDPRVMEAASTSTDVADTVAANDLDPAQYVVYNENGLFLTAEAGAKVLNREQNNFITVDSKVDRVEISWDGLKLRNWAGEEVFYADPDTGDLTLTGAIRATSLDISDSNNNKIILNSNTGVLLMRADSVIRLETSRTYAAGNDNAWGVDSSTIVDENVSLVLGNINENSKGLLLKVSETPEGQTTVSSYINLSTDGLSMSGRSVYLGARSNFQIESGGMVQISALSDTDNFIQFGNLSDDDDEATIIGNNTIYAPTGTFKTVYIDSAEALNTNWVNIPIVISMVQPSNNLTDVLWIKPGYVQNGSATVTDTVIWDSGAIDSSYDDKTIPNGNFFPDVAFDRIVWVRGEKNFAAHTEPLRNMTYNYSLTCNFHFNVNNANIQVFSGEMKLYTDNVQIILTCQPTLLGTENSITFELNNTPYNILAGSPSEIYGQMKLNYIARVGKPYLDASDNFEFTATRNAIEVTDASKNNNTCTVTLIRAQ